MSNRRTLEQTEVFSPPREKLKLKAYVMKYPKEFIIQAVGGICYNTVVVFGAIFLGKTLDAANSVYHNQAPLSVFYYDLAMFIITTLFFQFSRYFKRYYMRAIVNRMKCDMRSGLLSQVFEMPMISLSKETVGDMMSRTVGDVDQVGQSVQTTITEMWDTALLMASYLVACFIYDPTITLLAVIPVPLTILLAEFMRHPLYSLFLKSRKAASRINVHLQHNVTGIALLRLFGLEDMDRRKFKELLKEQLKWNVWANGLRNGMMPVYDLLATCGIIVVIGLGGKYVMTEKWTIGMFTAYLSMFTAMAVRTHQAAKVFNTWHGAKASWDRIKEKLSSETEVPSGKAVYKKTTEYSVEVKNLSFKYPFTDETFLNDISFAVKPGEIYGFTGSVGSGKSALAAALSGLFPYGGEVFINGISLNELGEERSKHLAYMDAEHFVFSDDIAFNITLERDIYNLHKSLDIAELSADIEHFSDGVETRVMERGVRVSGGQRQRLSLARAWHSNAEILILDDPFSAIDVTMEQKIMNNIKSNLGNKTILLFSHRLSTFPHVDKVLVLDKGCIREQGTHDELIKYGGLYKDIFSAQAFIRGENDGQR